MEYPRVQTFAISSKYVRQTFKIQVMLPARNNGELQSIPVLYATDGNLTFDMFKGISYLMQRSERDAPPFMLVGIGYPGESPEADLRMRGRDLTFPGYPQLSMKAPYVEGVLVAEAGMKDFYGAAEFQRFIEEELVPFVDERYQTIPGDRTYFGHSAGGGFGLFTLFTKSDLFKNYIISSPGLIYDGESPAGIQYDNYDFVLQDARKFIASGKSLSGIKVYMSVGGEEEFERGLEQWHLTSSFYRMVSLMKAAAISGLTFTSEVFSSETHNTVWPMAFIHGIQAVFGTGAWSKEGASAKPK